MTDQPTLAFRGVTKRYGRHVVVSDIDFDVPHGKTVGIVGESGSGKTTCVRMAIGLERPSAGSILFEGTPYLSSRRSLRSIRRRIGYVFQDPYDSLDPRMTIGRIVAEPLRIRGVGDHEARQRAAASLASVGLPDASLESYPAQYSGGGRQRIAIARALVLEPSLLLCDEPTASLDVSVQAQIVNLLLELQASRNLSMVFVSHDLDLVRRVSENIVVMYEGRAVEYGRAEALIAHPHHPYTVALLDSIPADDPRCRKLVGTPAVDPDTSTPEVSDVGCCVFKDRCDRVLADCRCGEPSATVDADEVSFRCLNPYHSGGRALEEAGGACAAAFREA